MVVVAVLALFLPVDGIGAKLSIRVVCTDLDSRCHHHKTCHPSNVFSGLTNDDVGHHPRVFLLLGLVSLGRVLGRLLPRLRDLGFLLVRHRSGDVVLGPRLVCTFVNGTVGIFVLLRQSTGTRHFRGLLRTAKSNISTKLAYFFRVGESCFSPF